MEFIGVLLLMALLYGLPELLRKKQKKQYEYPQFPPEPVPPDATLEAEQVVITKKQYDFTPQAASEVTTQFKPTQLGTSAPLAIAQPESFDSRQVVAGVIWAEILTKPKQVKPYLQRKP